MSPCFPSTSLSSSSHHKSNSQNEIGHVAQCFGHTHEEPSFPQTKTWTVTPQSWVIGGLFITRNTLRLPGACWSDGKGGYCLATPLNPGLTYNTPPRYPFTPIRCAGI